MNEERVFELFDLRVVVESSTDGRPMACDHPEGSFFEVQGEKLIFSSGKGFPLYPLAAILPLLPAKQRMTDAHDWMSIDERIACPDPNCGGVFRINRLSKRRFRLDDVTILPETKKSVEEEKKEEGCS